MSKKHASTLTFNKIFNKRNKKIKDQEIQVNHFTPEEELIIKKAIDAGYLDNRDTGNSQGRSRYVNLTVLETKCEILQQQIQQLVQQNEITNEELEKQSQLIDELNSQKAEATTLQNQVNGEIKEIRCEREKLLDSFKLYEMVEENTKRNLEDTRQRLRIVKDENIGMMRQSLINRQDVVSSIADVHDRIIQTLNNLLQKENLTEDNAKNIRRTMEYFTYVNMKNCLVPQVILLELDTREMEIEQERLLSLRQDMYKRIETLETNDRELGEVPLKPSEFSQNLIATQLYQILSKIGEGNQNFLRNGELTKISKSAFSLSRERYSSLNPRKGTSLYSVPNIGYERCLREFQQKRSNHPEEADDTSLLIRISSNIQEPDVSSSILEKIKSKLSKR